jgi:hypothetical protein
MSELTPLRNPYLAFVGMHGPPEATGLALRESNLERPIDGWDVIVANEAAIAAGVRFVKHNMALIWGEADPTSDDDELRRPAELLEETRGREIILDIHDQPTNGGDHILIGKDGNVRLLGVAALLGTDRVIVVSDKRSLVGHKPNAAVVEFGRGNADQLVLPNVERLRKCMDAIARGSLPTVNPADFDYYERITEIHTSRAQALALAKEGRLEPFESIPPETLALLKDDVPNLPPGEYVADYWNGDSSSPDWFGSVLQRISSPF